MVEQRPDARGSLHQHGCNRWRSRLCVLLLATLCAGPVAGEPSVMLGVDVFLKAHTHLVRGLRVGLLTNQTGRTGDGRTTIDALYRHPDVNLQVLFAPEHGIRGKVAAGEHIDDSADRRTGLPIISLYGKNGHQPPPEAMARLDVLIYDIQDVGSRAYTYIWSMAKALEAAARDGKILMVFDRPNPLGGTRPDGPITEAQWRSFIGLYPIPRAYRLTVGELARYLNQEEGIHADLVVIPMAHYRHNLRWQETGLQWVGPSPNIPSPESAVCFPATGTIGTLGTINIGIGTARPFQMVGGPWLDAPRMAAALTARNLGGVRFKPVSFTTSRGQAVQAVLLQVTSPAEFMPTTVEVHMLAYLNQHYPSRLAWPPAKYNGFDKAMGTSRVRLALQAGKPAAAICRQWQQEMEAFSRRAAPYRLYP